MIVREGQTNLLFHLEATARRQEYYVGRLKRVGTGEGDNAMVETAFEGGLRGPADREMPFERLGF